MDRTGLEGMNLAARALRRALVPWAAALIAAAFGFTALAGFIYADAQRRIIPYVVTVDRHGAVIASGELKPAQGVAEEIIAAACVSFIGNLRLVTADRPLQRAAIEAVYAHLKADSPALGQVNDFYRGSAPGAEGTSVNCEFQNVIRTADHGFQVDWIEIRRRRSGAERRQFRALLSYELIGLKHRSLEALRLNPLGIFFTGLNITERFDNGG